MSEDTFEGSLHPYINPANAVTASRLLTLPPFLYCIDRGLYQWALLMVVICAALDKVDGPVARLFHCASDFGAILDAVTDGVCYAFMFIVLVAYGWVPWPPVIVILGLGLANVIFRGIYARRAGRAVNFKSIAMERTVAFNAYLCGFGVAQYEVTFFYYSCMIVMAVVVLHDAKRMLIDPGAGMIFSHEVFMWTCSGLTVGMAGPWLVYECILLRRHLPKGPEARDEKFGAVMGLVISLIGLIGVLKFHLSGGV